MSDHVLTRPSDPDPAAPARTEGGLRGNLGVASIVFMVAAAASPLGVIGGPVPLGISIGNGTGFPATYLITGLILLLFAVGFTAMTPFVRSAGAFSSYVAHGLGARTGIGTGFVALLSYITLEAAVYGLLGSGVVSLLSSYGLSAGPWWLWAAAAFALVTFLGHRNIELSGKVLAIGLVSEVLIVLVLDVVVLANGGPEGLSTGVVDPQVIFAGAPGLGLLFAILSFIGFEATAVFRDEVRSPERTIPRATFLSLALVASFYALSSWALITGVGDSRAVETARTNGGTMLADVTGTYLGTVGAHLIQVLFVTSLLACVLAFHNIVARYVFSLSTSGSLHPALGKPHTRYGSPHRASAASSVVVALLLIVAAASGIDPITEFYTWLAGFSAVGVVLLYTLTSIAVLVFFTRNPNRRSGRWRTQVAPAAALLGLLCLIVLIIANLPALVGGSTSLAVGIIALLVAVFALGVITCARRDLRSS